MFRKNTASQFIHFQGVDATTAGIKTGVSWTVRRCIDGTFAAATGTVTEDGTTGWYKFALSQADTNGNNIGFNFTGTGAVPQTVNIVTTAADPTDGVRLGLTALPNVASGSAGAIPTTGSGANQIAVNGSGKISGVVLTDTLTTYTGNTPQTADVAALITTVGAAGVGLTAVGLATTSRAGIRKNVALTNFEFVMTDSTNHNPTAGLTVSVTRSIDGGAFAAGTLGSPAGVSNGLYKVDFGAGDLNGTIITLRATATGADDLFVTIHTDP